MNARLLLQQSLLENEKLYHTDMTVSYRKYDEEFINTNAYKHISGKIRKLADSFDHPISVLDVGCGTGRYFHTLKQAKKLTGIDVSGNMLKEAQHPFRQEDIAALEIELIEGNFYDFDFGDKKFDFIYSVGVLGEHTLFDAHVCNKLHALLNEEGKLFFTVVDIEPRKNIRRKLAEIAYPLLPPHIKRTLDKRWETCYMTWEQLEDIVRKQSFSSYEIERYTSEDPKWDGVHLECIATK